MTEDTKGLLQISLEMIRKINVENGISMGFDKSKNQILFFDTEIYLETGKFDGFGVPLENLVK